MLFVISDIHSCYDPMIAALKEKNFFESKNNKLVVVGDALDRGPDARKVIDLLLSLHKDGRLIYVRGNHENLFLDCLKAIENGDIFQIACGMSNHYANGTFSTLLQISNMTLHEALQQPYELVSRIKKSEYYNDLLPSCINYFETEEYVFAHGFIPCITDNSNVNVYRYDPRWRSADDFKWDKALWINGIDMVCKYNITVPNKTIVVGHIHSSYGHARYGNSDKNIQKSSAFSIQGLMAIDACTVRSGKVNCICLNEN